MQEEFRQSARQAAQEIKMAKSPCPLAEFIQQLLEKLGMDLANFAKQADMDSATLIRVVQDGVFPQSEVGFEQARKLTSLCDITIWQGEKPSPIQTIEWKGVIRDMDPDGDPYPPQPNHQPEAEASKFMARVAERLVEEARRDAAIAELC